MPAGIRLALIAIPALLSAAAPLPADAGDENPNGFGLYSPLPSPGRHVRAYRYDPRSWYYRQPGYYPYYNSGYWVPRAYMRYRYRYTYYGPRYRYFPAWGYGGCCVSGR